MEGLGLGGFKGLYIACCPYPVKVYTRHQVNGYTRTYMDIRSLVLPNCYRMGAIPKKTMGVSIRILQGLYRAS